MRSTATLSLTSALLLALGACAEPDMTSRQNRSVAPAPEAANPTLPFPTMSDEKPANFPGLHNVVAYAPGLLSGSVPEGEEGFESLKALGIKTIISVDGAVPDVEAAGKDGMRYVHYPITYGGISHERTLEISRAAKELPGPVYVHCHHGKHRSAGAAGAAAVTLGYTTPEDALARMKVSGTAANYKGLFECVKTATLASPADLHSVSGEFPERSQPNGFVATMVEVDEVNDHLKAIEKAGWKVPADHPDLVPAAEAGRLADLLRKVSELSFSTDNGPEFVALLLENSKNAEAVEAGLAATTAVPSEELTKRFAAVAAACKACHTKYRD